MRTTINVNDELLDALIKQTKTRTKTQAIETAIREYLDKKAIEDLISLSGKININPDWRGDEEAELNEYKDNG
ncbi:MAG: type II toxin-antitoxin system VapB family antitoxin [Deltaproteobacteria bacterium]|nr:type II toxin-antitoxin system VapB family antitoxin [Deltaproteobacteria bacterium]